MRKLKLQMQTSIDGYVAGSEGQLDWMSLDWMSGDWDDALISLVNELIDSSDIILMGRKMTSEFVTYWENVVNNQPDSPEFSFAQKMVNIKKIVFSKTQKMIAGKNVQVESGDLVTAVNVLKNLPGKDLIVYGGANFVSSLIENNLIDEMYLFVNPIAIGKGLSIFKNRQPLQLASSTAYKNGIIVNKYTPLRSK